MKDIKENSPLGGNEVDPKQNTALEAGDLISTGTPPGVGLGMKPPQYLKAGDVVELAIEGLGRQKQTCVNA